MVISPVCSPWLGEASIAGGNGDWRSQGSGMGRIETRRKQTETRVRRRAFIGRWSTPRHAVEEGEAASERGEEDHGVLLASMRVEEMRTSSSCYFSAEEVSGLGWAATRAVVLGCQGGLMLGSFAVKIQVRFFSPFSLLFIFCFVFLL
jgi:hypothetical protein